MEFENDHPQSDYSEELKTYIENVDEKEDTGHTTTSVGSNSVSFTLEYLNNSNSDIPWPYHDDETAEDGLFDEDFEDNDYTFDDVDIDFDNLQLPPGVSLSQPSNAASSSSLLGFNDVMEKYLVFKRFDIVDDFSDHYYSNVGFQGQQQSKEWVRAVQDEWKILQFNLPDKIYVRACESRMDLLRAVIVGPQGTPYHDGLFVFDACFNPTYPDLPPEVYYHSGGLRLNPNLYECGKVCLSLLNTWSGGGNEMWVPKKSTMLQVLVSIQALVLNEKPFFNEPGYEENYVGEVGERKSNKYNERAFLLSLKTMMYSLKSPPKYFEDLVVGHFITYARDILSACKEYMDGAQVGSLVSAKLPEGSEVEKNASKELKDALARMMNGLVTKFVMIGAKDCEQFRISC